MKRTNNNMNDTVYRSLSVEAPRATAEQRVTPVGKSAPPAAVAPAPSVATSTTSGLPGTGERSFKKLPVPFRSYVPARTHVVCGSEQEAVEVLGRIRGELKNSRAAVDFTKEEGGFYEIRAFAPDGAEHVKFQVCLFESAEDSPKRFLIEASRLSGCAYFFHALLAQAFGRSCGSAYSSAATEAMQEQATKLFRPPPLPEELRQSLPEVPQAEYVNTLKCCGADHASSDEQRREGCCALLQLCYNDEGTLKRFKACEGWDETVTRLAGDADPIIKNAGQRLAVLEKSVS